METKPLEIKFKKLTLTAKEPFLGSEGAAAFDLFADSCSYINIETIQYGTGIAIEIPKGYVGLIYPRSSISKQDLILRNSVGVIDSDYRGEIKFNFLCISGVASEKYNLGDRIGQLMIVPYPEIKFKEVKELSETQRGEKGFGSTGK